MPGFSVYSKGNFHLNGNLDQLSRATEISKGDLLSGKYSAEDIFTKLFSKFGHGIWMMFGFGIIDNLAGCIFDAVIPNGTS